MVKIALIIAAILIGVLGYRFYNALSDDGSVDRLPEYTTTSNLSTVNNPDSTKSAQTTGSYSASEVAGHNSANDCWMIISGSIYNVTEFIPNHPGGKDIVKGCGKDATNMFSREREHQENNASDILPQYLIGTLSK